MRFEQAQRFIQENARPVDLAVYRCFFEEGDPASVAEALSAYQNPDGGFGHGLEADNWNPCSNPIAVNDALFTLHRVGGLTADSPMLGGMLRYLRSHDSFDEEQQRWRFAIDSNALYPHAIWWERHGDGLSGYNPTVSLSALMCCFEPDPAPYAAILRRAFDFLAQTEEMGSDGLRCYMLCWELLTAHRRTDIVDPTAARRLIQARMERTICPDVSQYGVTYVPAPSDFLAIFPDFATEALRPLIDGEKRALDGLQQPDGSFDISWQWRTDYPEFAEARRWWRPRVTLDKLLFCRSF